MDPPVSKRDAVQRACHFVEVTQRTLTRSDGVRDGAVRSTLKNRAQQNYRRA
jgi:hypothetical protein